MMCRRTVQLSACLDDDLSVLQPVVETWREVLGIPGSNHKFYILFV
jgi:hypothetical protein